MRITTRRNARSTVTLLAVTILVGAHGAAWAADDEKAKIESLIVEWQKAGHERNDYANYIKMWTDDAKITMSRDAAGESYPVELNLRQIRLTRRLMMQKLKGDEPRRLIFANTKVTLDGDRAEFVADVSVVHPGRYFKVREVYKLRRTSDGWRVYANHSWPLEKHDRVEGRTVFNDETYARLDRAAERAKRQGDDRTAAVALYEALRFTEAHRHMIVHCETNKVGVADWAMRGWFAIQAGDGDDAVSSFKEAKRINPDTEVPETE